MSSVGYSESPIGFAKGHPNLADTFNSTFSQKNSETFEFLDTQTPKISFSDTKTQNWQRILAQQQKFRLPSIFDTLLKKFTK